MKILLFLAVAVATCAFGQSTPMSQRERLHWAAYSTVGPPNLAGGLFSAAFGTLTDKPKEYGPHWEGFGKRYAMRLTGSATSSLMEAELGSLWGEDPRYHRAADAAFKGRLGNAVKSAFLAHGRDGKWMPAYARYAAVPGSNFLANTWRADSEARAQDALIRTGMGFASRIVANTFSEFWPDVKKYVFRQGR